MKGANIYAPLFKTGQYGKLYIVSGEHARGLTFRIQVLPEGETAIPNGSNNLCTNKDAVEVYGVIGGHPGWTEEYGWLHRGKWCQDFETLVSARQEEIARKKEQDKAQAEGREYQEKERVLSLLEKY